MKEQIILAPGVSKNELLKSLASHGVSSMNLRIMNAGELARFSLMRSGIAVTEELLSVKEETVLIRQALEGEKCFGRIKYSDVLEISAAVRRMRMLVTEEQEETALKETLSRGIFTEKNDALLRVYQKYMQILQAQKKSDAALLIRKAIRESGVMSGTEFLMLSEFPLSPLERALIEKLSAGSAETVSVADIYRKTDLSQGTDSETAVHIDQYWNCYGAANETEAVISDIYPERHPDRCVIAVTDAAAYGQLFFDYALLYDLPVTFGCGIPVTNSNPAKLLKLYYQWMTSGFFGADALSEMLQSPVFDRQKLIAEFPETEEKLRWNRFVKELGKLRLTNDPETNKARINTIKPTEIHTEIRSKTSADPALIPYFETAAKELSLSTEEFIRKYSFIRKDAASRTGKLLMKLDLAALNGICEDLHLLPNMTDSSPQETMEDLMESILKKSVMKEACEPGKMHVTDLPGAFSCVRENLYIMGMSASKFPGSPRENYLLLDEDLKLFGEGADIYTSVGRITRKRENMKTVIRLASRLHSRIIVSFAGMNVAELKKDNKSSVIFELFREEHGENASSDDLEKQVRKVDYFEPAISVTREVGKAYTEGKQILPSGSGKKPFSGVLPSIAEYLNKDWSYSALMLFFECRRRFYLKHIMGIQEPEETDPFTVLPANDSGTLAHELMERLAEHPMTAEDFHAMAGEAFDRYIEEHPVLISSHTDQERDDFLEMMDYAYDSDPGCPVLLAEDDIYAEHESGVKLHVYPDRVEQLPDGSCRVVDYKTGRRVSHQEDDIDSCLQTVIYAYLMEKSGRQVSGGEYRYIRAQSTVSCKYDEEMKEKLYAKMEEFREALLTGSFGLPEKIDKNNDPCRYCKFGSICGKGKQTDEDAEGED